MTTPTDPLAEAREALAECHDDHVLSARHLRTALTEADRLRALLTPPTDAERAEWGRLCEEATPDPWTWDPTMEQLAADGAWLDFTGPDDADTRLVMAARTALPRLLAALSVVEGERDEARAEIARMRAPSPRRCPGEIDIDTRAGRAEYARKLLRRVNMSTGAEHAMEMALEAVADQGAADRVELRAERDTARQELRAIDAAMARIPALDKPTRAENVAHAVAMARKAYDAEVSAQIAARALDTARAEVGELRAALDNERGEGAPPSDGWEWREENGEGFWWRGLPEDRHADVTYSCRPDETMGWHWWIVSATGADGEVDVHASGWADTARAAMIAADASLRGGAP